MSEEKQSNEATPNQPTTGTGGSAGERLDQFISGAKRLTNVAANKAKDFADAAAPRIKQIGEATSQHVSQAVNRKQFAGRGGPIFAKALAFYRGASGKQKQMILLSIGGSILALMVIIPIFIHTMSGSKTVTKTIQPTDNDAELINSTSANSSLSPETLLVVDAIHSATAKAKALIPKVTELNGRWQVVQEYKDNWSQMQTSLREPMKAIALSSYPSYPTDGNELLSMFGKDDLVAPGPKLPTFGNNELVGDGPTELSDIEAVAISHRKLLLDLEDPNALASKQQLHDVQFPSKAIDLYCKLLKPGDPDAVLENIAVIKKLLAELQPPIASIINEPFNVVRMPATPNGLTRIAGETHLVESDHFIMNNQSITIPDKYKSLYIQHVVGPNNVVIVGDFRFTGNSTGVNGFSAAVNVENYECDSSFADKQLAAGNALASDELAKYALQIHKTDFSNEGAMGTRTILSIYNGLFGADALKTPASSRFETAFKDISRKRSESIKATIAAHEQQFSRLLSQVAVDLDQGKIKSASDAYDAAVKLLPGDPRLPSFAPFPITPSAKRILYFCNTRLYQDETPGLTGWPPDLCSASALSLGDNRSFNVIELSKNTSHLTDVPEVRWYTYKFKDDFVSPNAEVASNDARKGSLMRWQRGDEEGDHVDLGGIPKALQLAFEMKPDLVIFCTCGTFPQNEDDVKAVRDFNKLNVRIEVVEPSDISSEVRSKLDPLLQELASQNNGFIFISKIPQH